MNVIEISKPALKSVLSNGLKYAGSYELAIYANVKDGSVAMRHSMDDNADWVEIMDLRRLAAFESHVASCLAGEDYSHDDIAECAAYEENGWLTCNPVKFSKELIRFQLSD